MPKILSPDEDPMGAALLDYMKGEKGGIIKVSSDIAISDFIPVRYLFRTHRSMPAWETGALETCKGKVLDIGAAAGSHSLFLQAKGVEVVGMDISPGAVAVMEQRGLNRSLHADIFEFEGERFDTLLMMMNGIGLVGDLHGLNAFLIHAKSLLFPSGQILLDSSDLSYLYEDDTVSKPYNRYEGIIQYQMNYKEVTGTPFYWLYLDFEKLKKHAIYLGYTCELLKEGSHYEYLARLTLKS